MNLRQLHYFVTVCDCRSFTKAADHLLVSQPALSQQIRRLETDMRVVLLDRSPQGLRLTPAGRVLLPAARDILSSVARAEQAVHDVRTGRQGDLHVLAVRSIATGVLPRGVASWHESFPDVVLRIADFPHVEAMGSAFVDGDGDVAIGPRMSAPSTAVTSLGFEELVVVADDDHALLSRDVVGVADLSHESWILFDTAHGLTRSVIALCADHGFQPTVTVWTGHVETALGVAAGGGGVTIVPDNSVRGTYRDNVRSLHPPVYREIFAYSRPDRGPFTSAYVDTLRQTDVGLVAEAALPSRHTRT
ncbi:LysR substrate-binding domain-containing protein [Pseudonocardia sp. RS010]|uniref:LysR family transcriptional regulator n=1 Tax=Pseudonocardia sp. RS010 TaxID=3385979 RepID=UPI0039A1B1FE